jgi:hypothetical protein
MARVKLSIHDLTPEQYEALDVEEKSAKKTSPTSDTRWKDIETPSIEITFFRPDDA